MTEQNIRYNRVGRMVDQTTVKTNEHINHRVGYLMLIYKYLVNARITKMCDARFTFYGDPKVCKIYTQ